MIRILAGLLVLIATAALAQIPGGSIDPTQVVTQSQLAAAAASNLAAMQAANASAGYVTAATAPVTAVNSKTGSVNIPTLCRQQSTALTIPATSPSSVAWTFPNTSCSFSSAPSCWMDVSTSSTSYVFDYPLNTARSTAAVTYSFTTHASVLTIALGSLSLTAAPPAGSTVVLTCTAPPV